MASSIFIGLLLYFVLTPATTATSSPPLPYVHPMIEEYEHLAAHPATPAWEAPLLRARARHLRVLTANLTADTPQVDVWRTLAGFNTARPRQANPISYLFGGGSGAGKSYLETVYDQRTGMSKNDVIWMDPDLLMGGIPCYANNMPSSFCRASNFHWEAGQAADALFQEAVEMRYHVVFDGTMKSARSTLERYNLLVKNNFTSISFLGASQPTLSSAVGAYKRALNAQGGSYNRWVPLEVVVGAHAGFSANYPVFSNWTWTNGTVELYYPYFNGTSTPLLLYANGTILRQEEYEMFLAKKSDTTEGIDALLRSTNETACADMYARVQKDCAGPSGECCAAIPPTPFDSYINASLRCVKTTPTQTPTGNPTGNPTGTCADSYDCPELSGGAIMGIVIAVAGVVAVMAFAMYHRNQQIKKGGGNEHQAWESELSNEHQAWERRLSI